MLTGIWGPFFDIVLLQDDIPVLVGHSVGCSPYFHFGMLTFPVTVKSGVSKDPRSLN